MTHRQWLDYDKVILERCSALLRIPGVSAGADEEVAHAASLGIPIYSTLEELMRCMPPRKTRVQRVRSFVTGFSGSPGSGKTTTAGLVAVSLREKGIPVLEESFATPIRAALSAMGIKKKGTDDALYRTGGTALSALRACDPDFYVNALIERVLRWESSLDRSKFRPIVLIDDVRYPNERAILNEQFHLMPLDWALNNSDKVLAHESEEMANKLNKEATFLTEFLPEPFGLVAPTVNPDGETTTYFAQVHKGDIAYLAEYVAMGVDEVSPLHSTTV